MSFLLFARFHIVVALSALGAVLIERVGYRWVVPFVAVCLVSFLAEHVGTGYGVPFGRYEYTGLLGPKLAGRVPLLIPPSWFSVALPAWILARATFPSSPAPRLVLGALWLAAWDLALDPAMSHLVPYWRWADAGPYYGMPWQNLPGWIATGLVLMLVLDRSGPASGLDRLPVAWTGWYYAGVALMPLGLLAVAGAWGAVLSTFVALSLLAGASVLAGARADARSTPTAPRGAVAGSLS